MINRRVMSRYARLKQKRWQNRHHHRRKHEVGMTALLHLDQQMVCLIVVVTNRAVLTGRKPLIRPMVDPVLHRPRARTRTAFILVAYPLHSLVPARDTDDGLNRVRGHVKPEGEQAEPSDEGMDKWSAHVVREMVGDLRLGYRPTFGSCLTG